MKIHSFLRNIVLDYSSLLKSLKRKKMWKLRETSLFLSVFRMDKLHMALTELCYAINHCNVIQVWEHGFVPREFFIQHLETRFNKYVYDYMYLCNKIYENIPLYFHNQGTLKFKNNVH